MLALAPTVLQAKSAGTVQFADTAFSTEEGGPNSVTLTRTGGSTGYASVYVRFAGGTATLWTDYWELVCVGPPCDPVYWYDGDSTPKTFYFVVFNDDLAEPDETVELLLDDPFGATIGTPNRATVTILGNDADVPTLGGAALLTMTLALAVLGMLVLRRQRKMAGTEPR